MGLVDYISQNPVTKAKKISSYDEDFVVATISKIQDSCKHLIEHKLLTIHKLNSILKSNSPIPKPIKQIAQRTTIIENLKIQIQNKSIASQLPDSNTSGPIASLFACY